MNTYESQGRICWRIIYPGLIFIGAELVVSFIAAMIAGYQILLAEGPEIMQDMEAFLTAWMELVVRYTIPASTASAVVIIPLMIMFMRLDDKREQARGTYRVYSRPTPVNCIVIFCLGIAAAATANNLLDISGLNEFYYEESEALGEALYQGRMAVEIIGIGILGPIAEELTFRGVTHRRGNTYFRRTAAMILSSLIFATFHGNMLQFVYAFLLGMLLAYVYNKYQSVLAPIMLHVGANLFSVIVSETSVLDFVEESNTAYIIYVAISAVLTIVFLYFVYMDRGAQVITPSALDLQAGSETQDL